MWRSYNKDASKIHTEMHIFTNAQTRSGWVDSNQILHIGSLGALSDTLETVFRLAHGLVTGASLAWKTLASKTAYYANAHTSKVGLHIDKPDNVLSHPQQSEVGLIHNHSCYENIYIGYSYRRTSV